MSAFVNMARSNAPCELWRTAIYAACNQWLTGPAAGPADGLTDESVCPTLVRKGLGFCGEALSANAGRIFAPSWVDGTRAAATTAGLADLRAAESFRCRSASDCDRRLGRWRREWRIANRGS